MPAFDSTTTIAALLITALLLSWLWAKRRLPQGSGSPSVDDLDTIQDFPPQAVRVLTLTERKAYEVLRRALPGHLVLAQVPLSRFISVPAGKMHGEWLNRVGRLSVDLLVCDARSSVIAAIEIRTADETPRSARRHARLARVLQAARIPVQQWSAAELPGVAEVRSQFMAAMAAKPGSASANSVAGLAASSMLPVPDMFEVLADGDEDFANTPMHDPVPSGFFDDLDHAAGAGQTHH